MIQIQPLFFPTIGTASAVIVNCQSFEMLSETDISFNVRFFETDNTEVLNSPISLTRHSIQNKSEEDIISIIFEELNIQKK